jgi:hypothetical protein
VSGLEQRVLAAPDDGSLGPVLRIAADRLPPGAGYGAHEHRAVEVVAVVLAGSLRHAWGDGAELAAGDVGLLAAGSGLVHDEVAGPTGAVVVQTYLRAAAPGGPPRHAVVRAARGWVDLGRPDARLWVAPAGAGERPDPPPGLLLVARDGEVAVVGAGQVPPDGPGTALVWQVEAARPSWAAWDR